MRVRSPVSLQENPPSPDPGLLWYSRAIGIMRGRPFTSGLSWRWQGAVHDYSTSTDPYLSPSDPPPPASTQRTYWKQCQHSSWFFLPWHRMYLFHFERIVAAAVVEAGGPADWTLPYWEYEDAGLARKLPWAFRQPTWPGGEVNYLYVSERADGINAGTTSLSAKDVETAVALSKTLFSTAPSSSDVEFGGPRVKNHDGGAYPFGGVESSPHNHVHVAVGGPNGFMIDPTIAALDPIFWLHHANIDRLWEVWIRQTGRVNPGEKVWQSGVSFPFMDSGDQPVTMTCDEVVDTRKLGYTYLGMGSAVSLAVAKRGPSVRKGRVRTLGATSRAFVVKDAAKTVEVPVQSPLLAAVAGIAAAQPRRRTTPTQALLHLEHLQGEENPGSYDVYLNLPPGTDPDTAPDRFAGRISMFGAKAARRRSSSHARSGFSFVLDITDMLPGLAHTSGWDPNSLRATLVPVYDWSDEVTVGRVSLNLR